MQRQASRGDVPAVWINVANIFLFVNERFFERFGSAKTLTASFTLNRQLENNWSAAIVQLPRSSTMSSLLLEIDNDRLIGRNSFPVRLSRPFSTNDGNNAGMKRFDGFEERRTQLQSNPWWFNF